MKIPAAALLASTALLPLPASACPGLQVTGGWIRLPPKGAGMTAGYALLANTAAQGLKVEGARAAGFDEAELHRSWVENGMHRMSSGALELAPGARAALEPGGWHLMLFGAPALEPGQKIPVSFRCGQAATSFTFEVRAP